MKKSLMLYSIVGIIILLSFLLFSSVFYPLFNSDDGVTVLMLHYFRFPEDIYFWNQNRVGSIIPLIGQIFYKGFGVSSLWSESIVHYLILVSGYFTLSTLFKSKFSKVIFAIVWFFPILHFIGLVRYTFGLQYSLIGIAIYLMNKYSSIQQNSNIKRQFLLFSIFFVFVLSVWVADTAIITIFIILFVLGYFTYKSKKSIGKLLFQFETLYTLIASITGILIIYYLKSIANVNLSYKYNKQILNSFNEFVESLITVKNSMYYIFSFNTDNTPISIYAYGVVLLIILSVFIKKTERLKIPIDKKKWIWVFLLDGSILFFVVLISHWALLNGVARRYFTGVYIAYWIVFLLYLEYIIPSRKKYALQILVAVVVIIGALSTIYSYKYVYPKRLTPKAKIVAEFEQLGKIGIISEYWNSYGTSFVNPDLIFATPNDKSEVRNYAIVDSVFNQPKLYVIKDMWLDSFPNTLTQFGYKLKKKGKMFNIGDCWVCEYTKEQIDRTYKPKEFKYIDRTMRYDSISNKYFIYINKNCTDCINKHVIYGPYINIPKGHYEVQFHLKIDICENNNEFAILDVTANNGQLLFAKKILKPSDFKQFNKYENIQLNFIAPKQLSCVEFRIYYLGGVTLYFDSVMLNRK